MIKETTPRSGPHFEVYGTRSGSHFCRPFLPSVPLPLPCSLVLSPLPFLLFFPPSFPLSLLPSSLPPSLFSSLLSIFPSTLFTAERPWVRCSTKLSRAGHAGLDFRSSGCLKLEHDTVPAYTKCQQCWGTAEFLHVDVFYKSISFSPLHVGKEFKRERTRSWCFLRNLTHLLPPPTTASPFLPLRYEGKSSPIPGLPSIFSQ